jgi:hypothetical protein
MQIGKVDKETGVELWKEREEVEYGEEKEE